MGWLRQVRLLLEERQCQTAFANCLLYSQTADSPAAELAVDKLVGALAADNPEVRLLDTLAALDRASDRASVQDSRTDTAAGMAAWPAARLATGLSQQALPHFL